MGSGMPVRRVRGVDRQGKNSSFEFTTGGSVDCPDSIVSLLLLMQSINLRRT